MILKILSMAVLLVLTGSTVIIIIANAKYRKDEEYCDKDCEHCPFPPCDAGKEGK